MSPRPRRKEQVKQDNREKTGCSAGKERKVNPAKSWPFWG